MRPVRSWMGAEAVFQTMPQIRDGRSTQDKITLQSAEALEPDNGDGWGHHPTVPRRRPRSFSTGLCALARPRRERGRYMSKIECRR